jgi:hypothetical protein
MTPIAKDKNSIPSEVLRLIQEAYTQPKKLSAEEVREFISHPYYLGSPIPQKTKKRGPQSKLTPYDKAYARRRGLYHYHFRLCIAGANARKKSGVYLTLIKNLIRTEEFLGIPCHKLTTKIRRWFNQHPKYPQPDDTTIRRILRKLAH